MSFTFVDSALTTALYTGNLDKVKELVLTQADANKGIIKTKDTDQTVEYVPLSLACKHPPVVRYLLSMKAIINNRAGNGQTALHVAAHWGQLSTVKLLMEAKADPNDRTSAGGSALAQACMNENKDAPDVVEYLLSKGASPELSFGQGGTMLHETRHPKVATLLLDRGANVHATSLIGETPLMWASHFGRSSVVQVLLARGANPHHRRIDGKLPIDITTVTEVKSLLQTAMAIARQCETDTSHTATVMCSSCVEYFCADCDTRAHSRPRMHNHRRHALPPPAKLCDVDGKEVATWHCSSCDESFCDACDALTHAPTRAKTRDHRRIKMSEWQAGHHQPLALVSTLDPQAVAANTELFG